MRVSLPQTLRFISSQCDTACFGCNHHESVGASNSGQATGSLAVLVQLTANARSTRSPEARQAMTSMAPFVEVLDVWDVAVASRHTLAAACERGTSYTVVARKCSPCSVTFR